MKYNRDGTLYQLDTVLEAIEARCAKSAFPNLSDLLGADWGWDAGRLGHPTSDDYKAAAIARANRFYSRATIGASES